MASLVAGRADSPARKARCAKVKRLGARVKRDRASSMRLVVGHA